MSERAITHVVPVDGVDHEPVRCACGPNIYEDAAAHAEYGMPPEVVAEDGALTFMHHAMGEPTGRYEIRAERDADNLAAERDRLRAAVDAALALHVPEDRGAGPRCLGCAPDTLFVPYPCATARALAPVADPGPHTTSDEETTT